MQFGLDSMGFETGEEGNRQFSGTAYSGLPIMNHPFWGNLIFDTTTISSEPKIPVLFNHDANRIVGFGTLRTEGAIFIDGTISKATEEGRMVEGLLDEGFPMKESVYIEPQIVQKFSKGQKFTINGQELVGPFTVFRNSKVKEVSMTPLPADINTGTTIFNDRLNDTIILEEQQMSEEIKETEELKTEEVKEQSEETAETTEEKQPEPEVSEETKEPAEESDEKKFSDLVNKGDLTGAFKFACGCENKNSKKGASELEKLQAKFDELMGKYNDLKSSNSKKERFSEIETAEAKHGLKFSDSAKDKLSEMDKEALDAILSGLKIENKKQINPKLFGEVNADNSVIEYDQNDPEALHGAAMKFKEAQEAKGIMIPAGQAVLEFMKHQAQG